VLNLIQDIHFLLLRIIYFAFNKNLCKAVLEKWGREEMLEAFYGANTPMNTSQAKIVFATKLRMM